MRLKPCGGHLGLFKSLAELLSDSRCNSELHLGSVGTTWCDRCHHVRRPISPGRRWRRAEVSSTIETVLGEYEVDQQPCRNRGSDRTIPGSECPSAAGAVFQVHDPHHPRQQRTRQPARDRIVWRPQPGKLTRPDEEAELHRRRGITGGFGAIPAESHGESPNASLPIVEVILMGLDGVEDHRPDDSGHIQTCCRLSHW